MEDELNSLVTKPDTVSLFANLQDRHPSRNDESDIARFRATRRFFQSLKPIIFKSRSNRAEAVDWLVRGIASCGSKVEGSQRVRERWKHLLAVVHGTATDFVDKDDWPFMTQLIVLFLSERQQFAGQLVVAAGGPLQASILDFFSYVDTETKEKWFKRSKGFEALTKFAITNRNSVWRHLRWSGPRSHSPVAVAANPTFFAELDVAATIDELITHCPEFWTSEQVMESVQSGDIFAINPESWAIVLRARLTELRPALVSFVETAPWKLLCLRLLPVLGEEDVLRFAVGLLNANNSGTALQNIGTASDFSPLSYLVFSKVEWKTFEDLVIAAACGCAPAQLLRMVHEAAEEEKGALTAAVLQLARESSHCLTTKSCDRVTLHCHLLARCVCSRYVLQWLARQGEYAAIEIMLHANGIDCVLHKEEARASGDDEQGEGYQEGINNVNRRLGKQRSKRRRRCLRTRNSSEWLDDNEWEPEWEDGPSGGVSSGVRWSAFNQHRRLSTLELLDAVYHRIEVACATCAAGGE